MVDEYVIPEDLKAQRAEWVTGEIEKLHERVRVATKASEILAAYEELVPLLQEQHPELNSADVHVSAMAGAFRIAIKLEGKNPVRTWSIIGNLQQLLHEDSMQEIGRARVMAIISGGRLQ